MNCILGGIFIDVLQTDSIETDIFFRYLMNMCVKYGLVFNKSEMVTLPHLIFEFNHNFERK